jgi:D-3-phosphoglycerate dehydrogenase
MARVLIAEPLAEAGVELLRAHHEVDARAATTREELLSAVAGAEALVVRSATRVDAEVLEAGRRLKVVGRTWRPPPGWGSWWSTRPSPT